MIRLTSVDLPTLGRPTTATTGTGPVVLGRRPVSRQLDPADAVASCHAPARSAVRGAGRRPRRCRARWCRARPRPAACCSGSAVRVESSRSRRARSAAVAATSAAFSALRRWARGPPRRRSGRPSGRRRGRPPCRCRGPRPRSGRRAAMISRCWATSSRRTAGTAATAETAPVTSGPRISASTRDAVDGHAGSPAGRCRCAGRPSPATLATASASGEVDAGAQHRPGRPPGTSRRCRGSGRRAPTASRRETVDLPEPDGPSTATTHRPVRTFSATVSSSARTSRRRPVTGAVALPGVLIRVPPASRRSDATRRPRHGRLAAYPQRYPPPAAVSHQPTLNRAATSALVSRRVRPVRRSPEADRTDRGTHQPGDRVPDLVEHPPHDVLAPLVQGHLHLGGTCRGCRPP